jgi:hypothetical protein
MVKIGTAQDWSIFLLFQVDDSAVCTRFHAIWYFEDLGEYIFGRQPTNVHELLGHIDDYIGQRSDNEERFHIHPKPFTKCQWAY